ncbi:D-alanyl-D-alanine carboxypeptidase [Lentibacillus lipolyticus]|nr:D-alanyl-D-alanine carboxypeptidase [Lentibacillus lipolyticus]
MKKLLLLMLISILGSLLFISTGHAASDTSPPSVTSKAAVMMDADTGDILYAKDADKPMYPASLTKIATAIYAIEHGDLNSIATVSAKARNIEGTRVYLNKGEKVTLKKLIQGLLINSGNDAGVAIAEHLSGNVDNFASDLNAYLKETIGVNNTHVENPHGLYHPKHVTTARDLAKITRYAIKNDVFRTIFGTVELEWDGKSWDTTLLTHHKLMRQMPYEGITGGKTGFVDQSGFTLATTAERKDLSLIVITLDSNFQSEAYDDTTKLLDYGFSDFTHSSIAKGTAFKIDNQTYQAPKKLVFTHERDEELMKKAKADGELKIADSHGGAIASFQLKEVKQQKDKAADADVRENTVFGSGFTGLLILAAGLFLIVTGSYVYRRKKRKHNNEKRILM